MTSASRWTIKLGIMAMEKIIKNRLKIEKDKEKRKK